MANEMAIAYQRDVSTIGLLVKTILEGQSYYEHTGARH